MGISYSAVKTQVPEAFEIGKDYYGYTDLFPACAYVSPEGGVLGFLRSYVPPLDDLPHLVGSRHMVGSAVFRLTDYYASADEMIARAEELKKRPLDASTRKMFGQFFEWAGSDPLQMISDFDDLDSREAADEYHLCAPPRQYRHVDSWNGEAGREVGYDEEEEE